MNPGPVEEVGATARTTVDALRSSPLLLGTMVMQIVTIGILGYWAGERNKYESSINQIFERQIESLIKQCGPIRHGEIPLPLPFPDGVPRG